MPSKRSFFNAALFRKNLSRSWPLWGIITAAGCLAPLYILLALLSDPSVQVDTEDFVQMLYGVTAEFVPAAAFGYAILVAMMVWSYLYNNRSVGLMHTLPIDRTGLFVTNALSGLAILLIPYAAVGGFLCIIALCWGFMDLMAVLTTVLAVLLLTVLFFGIATLCAMVTGNVFALPVFYLIINFLAPALDALISILAQSFLLGVGNSYTGAVELLSPLVQIYESFGLQSTHISENDYEHTLQGFGVVALYGLVGLALLALAWLLYLRRKSECAGDVVAFRWLRPVFRYGVSLCGALTLGRLLYALIWEALFQYSQYADILPMAICMVVAGLVCYYGASMLLDKSLRVFRGSLPGAAMAAALCIVVCAAAGMDLFGVERYVPDMEEIDTVQLYASDMIGGNPSLSAEKQPELVEMVRDLHSAVVAEADLLKEQSGAYIAEYDDTSKYDYQYVRLEYRLKNGARVERYYALHLQRERWEQDEGFEGAFKALFTSRDLQLWQVARTPNSELRELWIYYYDRDDNGISETLDQELIYEALLADAKAGNLYDYDPFDDYYNSSYPINFSMEHRVWEGTDHSYEYSDIRLRGTMVNTIQELLRQGAITLEELQKWDEERSYERDYSGYLEPVAPEAAG